MKIIKLFLASSEELKPERLVIAELITKLNYLWAEYDISIRLVKWEYLDSSMGTQHKQEDYNDYLRQCDMCVVMYWTKFGMYTEIELETAYQLLNSDSCLKHMCVIFKEGGNMTDGLKSFRNKYETELGQPSKQWLNTLCDYDLQDMAQLAENLIAMTSLERHMTFSEEGVGGPIDLAIITKNNGFTWLSRKSWYHHVDVGGRYGKFGV